MPKNDNNFYFTNKVLFKSSMNLIVVLIVVGSLAACSERGAYEVLRNNQIEQCQRLQDRAREDCLKQLDLSYEEYQQAVDEQINDE